MHVGIALLTLSSHRTGMYESTTSLTKSSNKVRILWFVSLCFFIPSLSRSNRSPLRTLLLFIRFLALPALLLSLPRLRFFLCPYKFQLLFQLLSPLLLLFLLLFLFLLLLLLLLLLQFKRTLRTSLRFIPIFRLLSPTPRSSSTGSRSGRYVRLSGCPGRRFDLQSHTNCGPCEGISKKVSKAAPNPAKWCGGK